MATLIKLVVLVVLLGIAAQQGWLQAAGGLASGWVSERPGLVTESTTVASHGAQQVLELVQALPQPWSGLVYALCALAGLTVLIGLVRTVVAVLTRLVGWLQDALI